jgi:hypothetical protein
VQAASRRACIRCLWFACLEGQKERDRKIEGGGAAWVLKGGCRFANTHNNQIKFGSRDGGRVGEDVRLGQNTWGFAVLPV